MSLASEFPNPCFGRSGRRAYTETRRIVICNECEAVMAPEHSTDNVGYLPLHNRPEGFSQCVSALGIARCTGTARPGSDRCPSCLREGR
jgi:hypothetical protein